MGPIAIQVIEWAVAKGIDSVTTQEEKDALAWLLGQVDKLVTAVDATVSGPFKGVADEVAAGLHTGLQALVTSLQAS